VAGPKGKRSERARLAQDTVGTEGITAVILEGGTERITYPAREKNGRRREEGVELSPDPSREPFLGTSEFGPFTPVGDRSSRGKCREGAGLRTSCFRPGCQAVTLTREPWNLSAGRFLFGLVEKMRMKKASVYVFVVTEWGKEEPAIVPLGGYGKHYRSLLLEGSERFRNESP